MTRTKIIISTLLATIFLVTQVIAVGAAPATQETTPLTVTVDNITLETNADVTIVVVSYTDEFDATQMLRISLEDAIALGLVSDDGSGPVVNDTVLGSDVEIDPSIVILEEEKEQHPVGSAIAEFFTDLLGVDYKTIMDYHNDGFGFGVIAQALWMTKAIEGNTNTFSAILEAKRTKDFSVIDLPDGSTPTNWGQFRKAIMSNREKSKENLGSIMSGRAEFDQGTETLEGMTTNGKSNKSNGKSNKGIKDNKGNNGKGRNK